MNGKRPPLDEQKSLFEATIAAEGITTGAGDITGLSIIDAGLAGAGLNSFVSMMVVIHPGSPAQIDSRDVTAFNNGTGEVTVASTFKGGQVAAGVPYKIVTFRFVPAEVAALAASVRLVFHEQADVAVNITAVNGAETDVLHLTAADTRFIVRSLRLKCADPGVNTVTVRLYELVNDGLSEVDSFDIDATNFATYHSLMDMFGLPHLAGDELQVTVRASAGGPYAVTGQYSHGLTNI